MYLKSDFWLATPTPVKPNMVECRKNPGLEGSNPRRLSGVDVPVAGLARHDASIKLPLEFLDFDPPLGENPRQQTRELKAEFKRRFAEAEQALTDPERRDIVKESVNIFQTMEGVMTHLDKTCGSSQAKEHVQKPVQHPMLSPRSTNLGSRLRDSIAIAKGRLLRTRRRSSGSSMTASVPTMVEEGATEPSATESSQPSSVSSSSGEFRDIDKLLSHESPLARDAVVPGDGFRTIRYGSDLADHDKSQRVRSSDSEKGALTNPHGFDGANADIECCPIFRSTNTPAKEAPIHIDAGPNYALYAIISNFVVLIGIAMVFAAYLYVRHGEPMAHSRPLGL